MDHINAAGGANNPNATNPIGNTAPYATTQRPATGIPPYQPVAGAPAQSGNPWQPYSQGAPQAPSPSASVPLNLPFYGCPPMEAFKRFFTKYATFSGRASRSEFWWSTLFITLAQLVLYFISFFIFSGNSAFIDVLALVIYPIQSLLSVVIFIPKLAISVRRLHDSNRTGWWILVPIILEIISVIAYFIYSIITGYSIEYIKRLTPTDKEAAVNTSIAAIEGFCVVMLLACVTVLTWVLLMAAQEKPEGAHYDAPAPMQPAMQGPQVPGINQQSFGSGYTSQPMNTGAGTAMPQSGPANAPSPYAQQPGTSTQQPYMMPTQQPYAPGQQANTPVQQPNVAPGNDSNISGVQPPFANGNGSNPQ